MLEEDMLQVIKGMLKEDQFGHILKESGDEAFEFLICKDCSMVESVIDDLEQAKSMRIVHGFNQLPNTAATSSSNDLEIFPTLRQPPAPEKRHPNSP